MNLTKDCYKILEIASDASEKEIRKAWRSKTKEVHPDINHSENANAQFRELSEAMEILLDSASRLKHDRHFGYYDKPKNKKEHAKQKFSAYQTSKAEKTVNEWSVDYNVAMEMREKQRQKHLEKHKRNIRNWRIILLVLIALTLLLAYFI